jgi:hypothetical protein
MGKFGLYAEEEGRVETINDFNGKTVAKIQFDGGETLCITFTDNTELVIKERMQAGAIDWYEETNT